jgi:hypothetical protein
VLTITSPENIDGLLDKPDFHPSIFPEGGNFYKIKKPVVLITGRVHPG